MGDAWHSRWWRTLFSLTERTGEPSHIQANVFFFSSVSQLRMFRVFEAQLLNISKCGRQIKPSKPEVFTLWAFTEKKDQSLASRIKVTIVQLLLDLVSIL